MAIRDRSRFLNRWSPEGVAQVAGCHHWGGGLMPPARRRSRMNHTVEAILQMATAAAETTSGQYHQ